MGDGRIFLKSCRDASFHKDLSNEPNFDRIYLAGQLWVQMKRQQGAYRYMPSAFLTHVSTTVNKEPFLYTALFTR